MKLCGSLERSGSVMSVSSRLVSYKEAGNVLERGLESRCEGGEKGVFVSVVVDDVDVSVSGCALFVVFTAVDCCSGKRGCWLEGRCTLSFVVVFFMGCMAISHLVIIVVFPVVLIGSPFACGCEQNGFVLKLSND